MVCKCLGVVSHGAKLCPQVSVFKLPKNTPIWPVCVDEAPTVTLCIYVFIYLPLISKLQISIETFDNMDLHPIYPNLFIIRQSKHLRDPNFTLYSGVLTIKLSYNKTLK